MPPVEPSSASLTNPIVRYLLATRPAFLAASAVPVLIGSATAYASGVAINVLLMVLTLLGAVLIHAGVNVLNDYYDSLNGTDELNRERLFPFTGGSRFIQNGVLSRAQTARFAAMLLSVGALLGVLLLNSSGVGVLLIGLAGLLVGWGYSAPPLRLNSRGLGELSIALGFGVCIVTGSDYVQRHHFDLVPLLTSLPYGLLATALLYINQFPDRAADEQAGKWHWVVRLGVVRARWGYLLLIVTAYALVLILVANKTVPVGALWGLLPLPLSLLAARTLLRHAHEVARLTPAIVQTIQALIAHGLLLSAGLALAG